MIDWVDIVSVHVIQFTLVVEHDPQGIIIVKFSDPGGGERVLEIVKRGEAVGAGFGDLVVLFLVVCKDLRGVLVEERVS